jgi:hypothetical protein
MTNIQKLDNYPETDNVVVNSLSLSQLQSHQQKDYSPSKKHYLQLLESLGLKSGKGLLTGNKEDRICFENFLARQNQLRHALGIRKLSKIRAYKGMLDSIRVHECEGGLA